MSLNQIFVGPPGTSRSGWCSPSQRRAGSWAKTAWSTYCRLVARLIFLIFICSLCLVSDIYLSTDKYKIHGRAICILHIPHFGKFDNFGPLLTGGSNKRCNNLKPISLFSNQTVHSVFTLWIWCNITDPDHTRATEAIPNYIYIGQLRPNYSYIGPLRPTHATNATMQLKFQENATKPFADLYTLYRHY